MAVQSLPNETLTAIFENLQPCDLVPVLRASDRFRLVAERVLYANIFILDQLSRTDPIPKKSLAFCHTLSRRSHLADLPRKLGIRWAIDGGGGSSDEYVQHVQPALVALNRTLYVLPQLETLELALGLSGAGITVPTVLEGCVFHSLRLFALSGIGRGLPPLKGPFHHPPPPPSPAISQGTLIPSSSSTSNDDPALTIEHFLIATPSIQHLRLADHYERLRLPTNALPHLISFRGPPPAAASVCPGRAVQRLALVGGDYIAPADIDAIAQTSSSIVLLDLSSMSVTPSLLQALSRQLNGVATLRVRLALRHTLHFALSGIVSRFLKFPSIKIRRLNHIFCCLICVVL